MLHNLDPAWEPDETAVVLEAVDKLNGELSGEGHPVITVPVTDDALIQTLAPFNPEEFIVFNWCEELPGKFRGDVVVAQTLERLNFAYTGSAPEVLAFSWDKVATKQLLDQQGIPTPGWQVFEDLQDIDRWEQFPAIVKPACEHCSHGITSDAVVMDRAALAQRIAYVHETFAQPALVEDFVDGREFHVTLWGNGTVHALPPAEMDFSALESLQDRLCTFDSKFTPGSPHYEKIELVIPAPLNPEQIALLNRTAIMAYEAMGCRDYARIDLRLDKDFYYVLDINPNADFSPDTSTVYGAEAAGISYGELASWLVNLAAQRHAVFGKVPKVNYSA